MRNCIFSAHLMSRMSGRKSTEDFVGRELSFAAAQMSDEFYNRPKSQCSRWSGYGEVIKTLEVVSQPLLLPATVNTCRRNAAEPKEGRWHFQKKNSNTASAGPCRVRDELAQMLLRGWASLWLGIMWCCVVWFSKASQIFIHILTLEANILLCS